MYLSLNGCSFRGCSIDMLIQQLILLLFNRSITLSTIKAKDSSCFYYFSMSNQRMVLLDSIRASWELSESDIIIIFQYYSSRCTRIMISDTNLSLLFLSILEIYFAVMLTWHIQLAGIFVASLFESLRSPCLVCMHH